MTISLKDLETSKELDSKAMTAVAGGTDGFFLPLFSNVTDFSTYNSIAVGQAAENVSVFNNGRSDQSNQQASSVISTGAIQALGGFGFPGRGLAN